MRKRIITAGACGACAAVALAVPARAASEIPPDPVRINVNQQITLRVLPPDPILPPDPVDVNRTVSLHQRVPGVITLNVDIQPCIKVGQGGTDTHG